MSPGTRFVTVGGAIANDVHGKNHHVAGTFGDHVRAFELLRSDGERLLCSPEQNSDWFAATVGGLGLDRPDDLGRIGLCGACPGPGLQTQTCKFDNLDEFFGLSAASGPDFEYTVAWIDCLAKGKALGRGLFSRGNHVAPSTPPRQRTAARSRRLPFTPPVLAGQSAQPARLQHAVTGNRQWDREHSAISHYEPFFYPLDALAEWNRMYGPSGFLQYQCVVPPAVGRRRHRRIAAAHPAQRLRILPGGAQAVRRPAAGRDAVLSSPGHHAGAWISRSTRAAACSTCSTTSTRWSSEAGGAVYPAKDARMSGQHFRQYFPAWQQFQSFVDPRVSSSFWRRVMES